MNFSNVAGVMQMAYQYQNRTQKTSVNFDNLTEDIIQSFISKVLVYSDESLEICFRFKDELEELAQVVGAEVT